MSLKQVVVQRWAIADESTENDYQCVLFIAQAVRIPWLAGQSTKYILAATCDPSEGFNSMDVHISSWILHGCS